MQLFRCFALALLLAATISCVERGEVRGAVLAPGGSVAGSSSRSEPSSVVADPPPADWVLAARKLFADNVGRGAQWAARNEVFFARVRFELPRLSDAFNELHCPRRKDCRERMRYVRLRRAEQGLELLPDCSVLDEERLLDELTPLGPWVGTFPRLESGHALWLVGRTGAGLDGALEFAEPESTAQQIWEEWLYSRSVVSAYAASRGLDVPLLGEEQCTSSLSAVCEAQLATLGNPLALLGPTPPCPVGIAPDECWRRHLLLPVDVGHFQNFCGRTWLGPEVAFEPSRGAELTRAGVDVARLLLGSAWTAFGHRVPQVDILTLANAVRAMGLQERLRPRLHAVANSSDAGVQNRFRARILLLALDSTVDTTMMLREFRALVPCTPSRVVPCPARASDDSIDHACIQHTLGLANLACAHG